MTTGRKVLGASGGNILRLGLGLRLALRIDLARIFTQMWKVEKLLLKFILGFLFDFARVNFFVDLSLAHLFVALDVVFRKFKSFILIIKISDFRMF